MPDPDYFTLAEFRELPDMDDEGRYSDDKVEAAAAYLTETVEREVGVPLVPRTATETLDGTGGLALVLSHVHVRSLTSVTVGGTSVDVNDLTATHGLLRYVNRSTSWPVGISNVVAVYSYGEYATCPDDIKDPVMWATRDRLLNQSTQAGANARRTSVSNDIGGTTTFVLAGEKRPTGYPDLDAAIAGRRRSDYVTGFA